MPLPPKPFHSIAEISGRWQIDPKVIVGWAIEGRLALSVAMPQVATADGCRAAGLVDIAGEDVFALFEGEPLVRVHRFRADARSDWQMIAAPSDGTPVRLAGVVVRRSEAERFERAHRLFQGLLSSAVNDRPGETRVGAPARYDWDAFSGAMARRVFDFGMPASQGELVRDMIEWFAASHGATPDESTVRRRVQAAWKELVRPA